MSEPWIASRTVREESGNEWVVSVGTPRPGSHRQEFMCPFRIVRDGRETVDWAHGVDLMQALELAIAAIGVRLEESGVTLTWFITHEGVAVAAAETSGDSGFYRSLPAMMGFDFYRKMRRLVEDEIENFVANRRKSRSP